VEAETGEVAVTEGWVGWAGAVGWEAEGTFQTRYSCGGDDSHTTHAECQWLDQYGECGTLQTALYTPTRDVRVHLV
jgi:hypothetical protein